MASRSPSSLAAELTRFSRQRLDRFVPASIADLFSPSDEFIEVPTSLASFLAGHRGPIGELMAGWLRRMERREETPALVELLAHNTRRFLRNNNQFVTLDADRRERLIELYQGFILSFHDLLHREGSASATAIADGAAEALTAHRERLREYVRGLDLPADAFTAPGSTPCAEYSPQLQMEVLNLAGWTLAEPILDLGCGEEAHLVHHLRALGLEATGLDAFAPEGAPHLTRGDWLTHPLGRDRWGSILSHMAFSNHFLHHHLKGSPAIADYARRYMEIFAALRPGGSFIYTPGLPFLEDLLPRDRYVVERRPIAAMRGTEADRAITRILGHGTFYAARVRRPR